MWNNGHDAYMESRILSADPIELVNLLYQAGIQALRGARQHLANGEIAERSRCISKACEILLELTSVLDRERGGDIAQRLGQLYDYMVSQLLAANMQQSDAPLAEVLSLLSTLAEAWDGIRPTASTQSVPAERSWNGQPAREDYVSQGWSL